MFESAHAQGFRGERKDYAEKLNKLMDKADPAPTVENELGNMLEDGGAAAAGPLLPPSRD